MKKLRISRLLMVLAVTVVAFAATATISNAATLSVNTDDSDYKYAVEYDDGVVVSFTNMNLLSKKYASSTVYCRIEMPEGYEYTSYDIYNGYRYNPVPGGKCFLYYRTDDRGGEYPFQASMDFVTKGNVTYCVFHPGADRNLNNSIYKLKIQYDGGNGDTVREIPFHYTSPLAPTSMKIVTYPNKATFNSYNVSAAKCGQFSKAQVIGPGRSPILIPNGWKNAGAITRNLYPGKKYSFKFTGRMLLHDSDFGWPNDQMEVLGSTHTVSNVPMGPSTKPVISSAKVSNVKVKKYFNVKEWRYKYKTQFTVTVKLSKKALNTKGAVITAGGYSHTVKGTGKTFKTTYYMDFPYSWKGKTINVTARTYSDNKYMAYSYLSKAKKVKIR